MLSPVPSFRRYVAIIFLVVLAVALVILLLLFVAILFSFVGTIGYLAPEGPGTPQADLYSLGKVLYEASTGKDRSAFPEPATELGTDAEIGALAELTHDHILPALDYGPYYSWHYLVTPYIEHGTLRDGIHHIGKKDDQAAFADMAAHIGEGPRVVRFFEKGLQIVNLRGD